MIDTTTTGGGGHATSQNTAKLVESLVVSTLSENPQGLTDSELEQYLRSQGVSVDQKINALNSLLK